MEIEDKELFVQTAKDIMIPVLIGVTYLSVTILLSLMWMPMMLIMLPIGGGIAASFFIYKDRLAEKKREAERKLRGYR